MKMRFLLPPLSLLTATVLAVDPPAAPAAATAAQAPVDLAAYKTADELYKYFEKVQNQPDETPQQITEDDAAAIRYFARISDTATAFAKAYPSDPRRWRALLSGFDADLQKRRIEKSGRPGDGARDRARLDGIVNAADAPAAIKAEAAFTRVMTYVDEANTGEAGEAVYAEFYKEAGAFLAKNTDPAEATRMKMIELHVLSQDRTKHGDEVLKALAADAEGQVATKAREIIAKRTAVAELKIKPVELEFTAVGGETVDLAKMRGKVILVDFWASWCAPCLAEVPNIAAIYGKLRGEGFEVIGISLDEDKDQMTAITRRHKMSWPQYFDGQGFKNKISARYGIDAIPVTWLIDKKGVLRESNLHGPALEEAVTRLLKE
jgi:thiol-disulfide isomerase/thioredoxin